MANKITTIATVDSSVDRDRQYTIIQRKNGNWECNCKSFFFSIDRSQPCKHIEAVRTLDRVQSGQMTQKRVHATRLGVDIIERWRKAHDLPLIKP